MDKKTLEYMKERVDRGSQILRDIERLKERIGYAKEAQKVQIGWIDLSMSRKESCGFEEYAQAQLAKTFIDLANAEIQRLEEEFGRL
ncbi:hypothetical protein [Stenotrophomonas maltophilia group sp. RNC7]|uniref:hypothetical protein n=1 Tax=Stenotrophomonas maltophilia group sp. RNC7 TaxID=3071467 RepID=UPI0027DEC593|nr:hypothetical protein [Stenotrophomonas maltophilia group sp. RNC7]MDQ4678573.1 hypothetical protein [Stenotrophomonas maltophilia group sp. RNC7]